MIHTHRDRPTSPRRHDPGVPTGARRRRAPGARLAAVLAFVLGVSAAMWWAGRDGPPAFAIGAAAALGPVPLASAGHATLPRAGRGEARDAPAPPASRRHRAGHPAIGPTGPAAGPVAAPARTLMPSPRPAPTTQTPTSAGTVAAAVLRLTNAERAKVGCAALHSDSRLAAAAQGHSTDMATRGYFAHVTPEGETPWDRARAVGYNQPSAENIAMGYRTPAEVVAAWMASAGHRQNIVNCASHALGVGFDARGYYWTQLFGYV